MSGWRRTRLEGEGLGDCSRSLNTLVLLPNVSCSRAIMFRVRAVKIADLTAEHSAQIKEVALQKLRDGVPVDDVKAGPIPNFNPSLLRPLLSNFNPARVATNCFYSLAP